MKRFAGCLSLIVVVAFLYALTSGMEALAERIDAYRFPWGHAETGKPTLTGTWVGPITTGSGQRLRVLVSMHLTPIDSGRRRTTRLFRTQRDKWLAGRVLVCPPGGPLKRFTAWGAPDDIRTGSPYHLSLSPADSVPPDGLAPSSVKGRWNGGDTMEVALSLYLRQGKSAISSTNDPDTGPDAPGTLHRATDADSASLCSR